jgi:hypothetical protein
LRAVSTGSDGSSSSPANSFVHESTTFPEDSELWFSNHGPVAFVNPDGSIAMMLDWKFFADKVEDQGASAPR